MRSEYEEHKEVVRYLRTRRIPHFHVPNETYTERHTQKAANKALGVSSGVPDLFVLPNNQMIAIEMKKRDGGTTSKTQKVWLERLSAAGIPARVCKGADEAKAFIDEVLAGNYVAQPIIAEPRKKSPKRIPIKNEDIF